MNDVNSFAALENRIRETVAVPDARPEFVERLYSDLMEQAHRKAQAAHRPLYLRPAWIALFSILLFLALTVLIAGPQRVAAEMRKLLGYIPNFGVVEQAAPLRILQEPVSLTREGITATVTGAVLSSDKTVLLFEVKDVPAEVFPHDRNTPSCERMPELRLPDGSRLPLSEAESGSAVGERFSYGPVPANIDQATFIVPCLAGTVTGQAPEDWEFPLRFTAAPANLTVVPVVEVTPSGGSSTEPEQAPITIQAYQIGDQYILTGRLQPTATTGSVQLISWQAVEAVDATGKPVGTEVSEIPGLPPFDWGVRIDAATTEYPLTITFRWTGTSVLPGEPVSFQFDAGQAPEPGQEWVLHQPIQIGGRTIMLDSIQTETGGVYRINFSGDEEATGISADIAGYTATGGGGGGDSIGHFWVSLAYVEFPSGKLQVTFSNLTVMGLPQTWSTQWSPQTLPPQPAPTAQEEPGPCLTLDKWNQLPGSHKPLPEGMGGKLVTTANEGGLLPAIYISNPDGTGSQKLATGAWPSLSHDGTRLAYSASDGLRILDIASGKSLNLGVDGYRLIWSPDDTRLLFTNTFHLYIANVDGTGLQDLGLSAQVLSPVGWLPDSQTILYSFLNGSGFDLRSYDLQTEEKIDLFTIHNKAGYASLSPDGQWLVFADRLNSEDVNWGIYISHLDGSERKLVAEPAVPTAFTSLWNPDGQWLLVNTIQSDPATKLEEQIPFLVDPFTCQTILLDAIHGIVESWGR
jgi:hypothetical protein